MRQVPKPSFVTTSPLLVVAYTVVACLDAAVGLKVERRIRNVTDLADASQSVAKAQPVRDLESGNLVFDFGFYNGADSRSYLSAGMRVVAIEADPDLVKAAHDDARIQSWINSGQLKLLNAAIAPAGEQSWTKFYMNKCTQEWNSFHSNIGCRGCNPPHVETSTACTAVSVQATTCAAILQQYGVPHYLKLDIEGAESGCYRALSKLPDMVRPMFISGEVGDTAIVDTFHGLGYTSFKLVRQKSGITGAWGSEAQDCRTGKLWRSYLGAKADLQAMLSKPAVPGDVCPGSLVGGVWYDMHASRQAPEAW